MNNPVAAQAQAGNTGNRIIGLRPEPQDALPGPLAAGVAPINLQSYASLVSGEQIEVLVGLSAKSYLLPKGLLSWISPFFRAAFANPLTQRNRDGVTFLEDHSPKTFDLAIFLMIQAEHTEVVPIFEPNDGETLEDLITTLIELASLGQFLLVPLLCNAATLNLRHRFVHDFHQRLLTVEHVILANDVLEQYSDTLRVVMQSVARNFMAIPYSQFPELKDDAYWKYAKAVRESPGFLEDLAFAQRDVQNNLVVDFEFVME